MKVVWKVIISTIAKALMGFLVVGFLNPWKPSEAETNVAQLETIKKDLEGEVDKIEEPKEEEDGGGEEPKEGEEDSTPIDFAQVDKYEKGGEGLGQTETKQEGEDEALVDATGTTDDPADTQGEQVENPLENLIAMDPEKIAKTGDLDGEKKEDVTKEDDKVEQVIDANVNNILNKVHKVTGDLKIKRMEIISTLLLFL